mmetsp:Transcript_9244/g.21171  ORF Transcript_9244/g.21171 Transcript_9244/m.21171 type:complete len:205 (+) Transcript_9244:68-682(+)
MGLLALSSLDLDGTSCPLLHRPPPLSLEVSFCTLLHCPLILMGLRALSIVLLQCPLILMGFLLHSPPLPLILTGLRALASSRDLGCPNRGGWRNPTILHSLPVAPVAISGRSHLLRCTLKTMMRIRKNATENPTMASCTCFQRYERMLKSSVAFCRCTSFSEDMHLCCRSPSPCHCETESRRDLMASAVSGAYGAFACTTSPWS